MVSPKTVIWSPSAQNDLENIADYLIHDWSIKVVTTFLERLNRIIEQIRVNPGQYPLIHRTLDVRKCILTKHNKLYYRIKSKQIEIIRIFDTRQDPDKLKIFIQ